MLSLLELRDYNNWINKGPIEIRDSVIKAGGWHVVFPMPNESGWVADMKAALSPPELLFPLWASRVRNYFNEIPLTLTRLSEGESLIKVMKIKNLNRWLGLHSFALSNDVYRDHGGREWFEMSTAGGIYHYSGEVNARKKIGAFLSSQATIPVFKLISPDDTGGSLEVIIENPQTNQLKNPLGGDALKFGQKRIGDVGQVVSVIHKRIVQDLYQGSYNYSETVIRRLPEHEYRDVDSHRHDSMFYVDPPPSQKIVDRRFKILPIYKAS